MLWELVHDINKVTVAHMVAPMLVFSGVTLRVQLCRVRWGEHLVLISLDCHALGCTGQPPHSLSQAKHVSLCQSFRLPSQAWSRSPWGCLVKEAGKWSERGSEDTEESLKTHLQMKAFDAEGFLETDSWGQER